MALTFIDRRTELTLMLGLALGCSSQPEPETPTQPYQGQATYPQQQYPAGQYPAQQQPYPAQQQPYPAQQQPYPAQQQPYPGQQQPYPTTPGATPQTPPPAFPPPAGGALPPSASGAPLATAIDPSAAAAVQPLLSQLAATKAPAGAKPIGSVMAANFQQGQQLEAQVQMEPGKCYTVVGAGLPPITELDLKLVAVTPLPGLAPILAVDNTTGVQAVLGEKPNCYKWALPAAPVKIVVTATGGQGLAAAQLFAK